jgi:uncharacterized protein
MEIEKLKNRLMADPNILFALVFGSYARGKEKPGSDLDLALYFENPPEGLELLEFISRLSDLMETEVDLVVLNRASAFLRHQIMKKCIRLFIKAPVRYRQFREKTIADYQTYKYVSGMDRYDR